MQFILHLQNGKQIDMSSYILKQMRGEISRKDVEKIITNYKKSNERFIDSYSAIKLLLENKDTLLNEI